MYENKNKPLWGRSLSSLIWFHIWSDVSFMDYELDSAISPSKSFIRDNIIKTQILWIKLKSIILGRHYLDCLLIRASKEKWIPEWLILIFFSSFSPLIKYSLLLKSICLRLRPKFTLCGRGKNNLALRRFNVP